VSETSQKLGEREKAEFRPGQLSKQFTEEGRLVASERKDTMSKSAGGLGLIRQKMLPESRSHFWTSLALGKSLLRLTIWKNAS